MTCRFRMGFAAAGISAAFVSEPASADVDFARDIQPILNAKCTECHGGVKAAGDVSFVYEDRVINFESDSGYPVVKPGDLEESELWYRITTDDEDDVMPPAKDHPPLSAEETALIKQWIEEGAEWSAHWAFVPPVESPAPKSAFDALATGDIDRHLFARLEREGLEPSPAESPGRLLRRLSLGLTGLPPTVEELDAFEAGFAEDPQGMTEKAVDHLLSRPAFGERWASMWLDLVRYADSGGLGQDQRRTIWAYRDWVVKAFNDDLPFDQFTLKQLAGDLLPEPRIDDLVATACQRNTQTNNEGGTDDEEFRIEAVVDRVNTTWQTWGAITFGCVQCHDHPYDPLRHDEYYEFMAFFNNSADSDLPNDAPRLSVPNDPAKYAEAAALRQRILELKQAIWQSGAELRDATEWRPAMTLAVSSQNGTRYAVEETPTHAEFHTVGTVQTGVLTQIEAPASNFGDEPVTALRLTVRPLEPETAVHSPEWGFVINKLDAWVVPADGKKKTPVTFRWSVADVPWMPTDPTGSIASNGVGWGADSRIHHDRVLVLVPEAPLVIAEGGRLDLHIHCTKTGHNHPMVIKRGHLASTSDPRWKGFGAGEPLTGMAAEVAKATQTLNKIPSTTVPVMHERPASLERPTHVFARGNAMDKADRVGAGLPTSLTDVAPAPDGESLDRLAMAHWWVSERNPLTARVLVNRLWEQLFGVGIVPTLEDFGSSGEKPTHPELLDTLALRFQRDHAWSVKAMLREMVLSYAYRQSAKVDAALVERDPDNRLLARGPRLRLSAEAVRDHALAVSGLLSDKIGGPPVHPPIPAGVWQPFEAGDKWNTPKPGDPDRYRRSLYTYTKRSIPFPTFATFDAPSREFCTPRRLASNTPLQALVTLNGPAFVESAVALGERLEKEFTGSGPERLARAHRLVTGRPPGDDRLAELVALYRTVEEQVASLPEDQRSGQGAWTVVAQVLLNLDETLTY